MSIKNDLARLTIKAGLRLSFKLPSLLPLPVAVLRSGMEQSAQLFKVREDVQVESVTIGGIRAERLSPQQKTDKVILHLHGGAFFTGSAKTHRALGAEFAARAQAVVYMLEYRLAPEYPYPAALDDGLAAYRALLALGYDPHNIVLGGDSAGCAHILSLSVLLRDQGLALPAGLFMISPYVDMTLSAASITTLKTRDPMLTAYALRRGSLGYHRSIKTHDPRVSPLFADLRGLPSLLIQVGSEEILLDDALRLTELARAAGVDVDCQIFDGMWHNFQMFNAFFPVADQATNQIALFVKQHTGG
ncbi:alpha/beta hydrolase [Aquirhabdus parva]|uniref:Alpha/beta hydrolase n=1 Tax=Aquirhabdus parva TaxID=2283318 RepID=A0A345PA45_9GAMM|nr:alpha/beta hydrolase [Aquirhabdus parva]AXI04154.1 alpha/beta hydrolase [Aquirhabdus parva]